MNRRIGLLVLVLCFFSTPFAFAQVETISDESQLIKVLSSGSEKGDKALACKRLAVYGSEASVEELAKLLSDPQLASWARIALEAIPGDKPNAALRQAAQELDGLLLIGVVNSLGVRRDQSAIDLLAAKLKHASPEVASAAALALGKIGSSNAAEAMKIHFADAQADLRSTIAEALVQCAEKALNAGDTENAIALYDLVRNADVPVQRIVEATRGAILVRGEAGIELLTEQLRSPNRKLLDLGLQTAREISSDQVAPALIKELSGAPADRAARIVETLGALSGQADLKALLSLAAGASKEVRLAAISVLGRVGDSTILEPMLEIARTESDLHTAVRAALAAVPDEKMDQVILHQLPTATDAKILLLELVGLRQLQATDELVGTLEHSDASIREATLLALGETVTQDRFSVLVDQVVQPKNGSDVQAASRALRTAAVRMPDRESAAKLLSQNLSKASADTKRTLLETIAAVGGSNALATLADVAKDSDETMRDISTRLLGEWMSADVAPVLLDLAKTGPADRFQVRAVRGYMRVARQFVKDDQVRLQMCSEALKITKGASELRLVLDLLKRYPSVASLKLAIQAIATPSISNEARVAAQEIGKKLADNSDAQQLLKDAGL